MLNYLRSLERTIALDLSDGVPSPDADPSPDTPAAASPDKGGVGGGGGGGGAEGDSAAPATPPRQESAVRREDFYTVTDGVITTSDVDGRPVLYTAAQEDYDALWKETLAMGSYYITRSAGRSESDAEGQRQARPTSARPRSASSSRKERAAPEVNSLFNEKVFRQMPVDRGAVLLDAWMCEAE